MLVPDTAAAFAIPFPNGGRGSRATIKSAFCISGETPMKQVERIGVLNNGIFIANFSVQWIDSNGGWKTTDWNSGNFDNGLYKVSPPLSSIGVPGGAIGVTPYVSA